jgi:hypothetical protein
MIGTDRQKSVAISHPVTPCFATRSVCCNQSKKLVDESGVIRTQMGNTVDKKMVAVTWHALYDTPPLTITSNQYIKIMF